MNLKLLIGIIVVLFLSIALYLRIALPYDQVFSGDWIKFTGTDAYYHIRIVDNLVYNFPHLMSFDPYMAYPYGMSVGSIRFFDWFLASIIWVIGLGSPTQHTVDVVGVYFPAVLGALTVIPVYFIGKELFNRWAGIISAGLIAVIPGEFLGRSILGFTDQHIAETLFTTVTILFLILAIKAAKQRQLTFGHIKHREWAVSTKPLVYSLLAGISLGIYLLTWIGALLFVFIITAYFLIQFIIDHLRRKHTDYLCFIGVILFFTTLIMYLPVSQDRLYLASLIIALLSLLALSGVSRLLAGKTIKPVYYPLTLAGLGLAGLAILHVVNPSLLGSMLSQFSIFAPRGVELTTMEMRPFLFPRGNFTLDLAWGNFTTGFFLSLISLGILIYLAVKQGNAERNLLVVWSLVILTATLGQCRFGYYFAVNVALLTAYLSILVCFTIQFIIAYLRSESTSYLSWQILSFAGFKELGARPVEIPKKTERKKAKSKKRPEGGFHTTTHQVTTALGVIVVFFLVFFPNINPAIATASQARFAPSDAWCSALSWLKENTPTPFGDPDSYYELYESSSSPKPTYGVIAWWDYGYWITRIAHRVPYTNPSQNPPPVTKTAQFFLSQHEDSAQEIIENSGLRYIIIDHETALIDPKTGTGKFWAIVLWAERDQAEYFDIYYRRVGDRVFRTLFFYPEYYRSLSTRLYNFDGKAVTPESSLVISYEERKTREGIPYKEITSEERFDSYEEAEAYLLSQESANYRIVSTNPLISPVPLEELKHYRLIHSSESYQPGVEMAPAVKIFEYIQ